MAALPGPIRIRDEAEILPPARSLTLTPWLAERLPELDAILAAHDAEEAELVRLYGDGDTHLQSLGEGVAAVQAGSEGVDPEALTGSQAGLHDSASVRQCILDCMNNEDYTKETFTAMLASGVLPPGLSPDERKAAEAFLGIGMPLDRVIKMLEAHDPKLKAALDALQETTCMEKCGGAAGAPAPVPPAKQTGGANG